MQSTYTADQRPANVELVMRFMHRVWTNLDGDAIHDEVTEDFVDHAYQPGNAEGHAKTVRTFRDAFSDARIDISDIVADGDRVVIRMWLQARHTGPFRGYPISGQTVRVQQYRTFRIRDGRIAEHWALLDTATLLQQIGALPAPQSACVLRP